MSTHDVIRPRLAGLEASATLVINERTEALEKAGEKVFRLGFGASPFPVPSPVVEALRQHAAEKSYLAVQGLEPLREAVAEHHRRLDGLKVSGDQVLIGPGSKELLFLVQLAFAGQTLIPAPAWVSYAPQVQLLGGTPIPVPTDFENGFKVTPEQLERVCGAAGTEPGHSGSRRRLLILNYPQNPVGNTYSADELATLAEIARKNDVLILADEIYGRLHFSGEHVSISRFYPEGTLLSTGLSKWCGAGGWRLGTLIVPKELSGWREVMSAAASETFTSVSSPIQYAAITAFEGGDSMDRYLGDSRRILGALGRECHRRLSRAGVRVHAPEGGFYLFPDFTAFAEALASRGIESSPELARRLLEETGVASLPGIPFGRAPEDLTLRLCFVGFDGARALRELGKLESGDLLSGDLLSGDLLSGDPVSIEFLNSCCGDVLQGIDRIVEWLHEGSNAP